MDRKNWVDSNGHGCNDYTLFGCTVAGRYVNADGIDASSACCICGGLGGMIFPDSIFCNFPFITGHKNSDLT